MPSNRECIISYLKTHREGADDDQLAARLAITPRQQVNQICRALANNGLITRHHDPDAGKIVNRIRDAVPPKATKGSSLRPMLASRTLAPAETRARAAASHRLRVLANEIEVREFAYAGELQLSENEVKRAVGAALQAEGWDVVTQWGHARGIDLEARRGGERLVVEAKGEGSLNPMRVNYFLHALGELLQRMRTGDARYGLAFPAHRQFVGLILRLPTWVCLRLNLWFFLVRPAELDMFDVGCVSFEASAHATAE
jgi:hypothetical protein